MTVKEFLESTYKAHDPYNKRPRIECADGFSVSVQGGTEFHYCTPRDHCNVYGAVELGYPSEPMPELMKYAEEPNNPTETVYGWVPLEEVEALVVAHGGLE